MNLNEAKKIIVERCRAVVRIDPIPNRSKGEKRWQCVRDGGCALNPVYHEYTDSEIIGFARHYTADSKYNTSAKKNVKHFSDRKNRAAERAIINRKDFEKIPQDGPTKTDDIWNWD